MIKSDLGKLDRLTQVFYEKALGGCIQSGLLTVRIWERKHELLGMNAAAKFEVVTAPPEAPPRHEKIRMAIERLTGRKLPQNIGNGPPLDDDSAVDELSPSNRDWELSP
jgi:hypothetical protein